jgi:hypothetical protein
MKRFHPTEILIPLMVVVVYSQIVIPTPILGAAIVFFVTQVIVRGIRNSIRA